MKHSSSKHNASTKGSRARIRSKAYVASLSETIQIAKQAGAAARACAAVVCKEIVLQYIQGSDGPITLFASLQSVVASKP